MSLKVLCDELLHTRFEPSGWTGNEELGYAKSIMDYLFRWIELRFLSGSSFRCLHSRLRYSNDKAAKRQTMLPPAFRNSFTTAMRLAMRRSVSPVGH